MGKFLEDIIEVKDEKIKSFGNEMNSMETNITEKIEDIKTKQNTTANSIKKINENVEKINKFIKK